jgi:hypothetical protein
MSDTINFNIETLIDNISHHDASADDINWAAVNIDKVIVEIRNFYFQLPTLAIDNMIVNVVKTIAGHSKISGKSHAEMYDVLQKKRIDIPSIDSIFVESENCTSELLDVLSNSLHWGIKLSVVKHENVSPDTLAKLSCDSGLKNSLSKNKNCSVDLLERLATDDMIVVQINVCKNPSSPLYVKLMTAEHAKDLVDDLINEIEPSELMSMVRRGELSMARVVHTKDGDISFGDFLLSRNLLEYYQLIQSTELKIKLDGVANDAPSPCITKPRKTVF